MKTPRSGKRKAPARRAPEAAAALLERITDGFLAVDSNWRITYANSAVAQMARRQATDLIGKVLWEEFPDALGTAFEENYRQALATQQTRQFEAYFPPLDLWVHVRVYPSPSGLSIYAQDVTLRRKAEEALSASEARYRQIAETAHEGMWLTDAEYRGVWVNRRMAEILGAEPAQLIGRSIRDFIHPDDLPLLQRKMEERREGQAGQYDIRMRRLDGTIIWVLARISPVLGADGSFQGALGMLTDISERKRAEQELHAQREWFRTTLSSIGDAVIATDDRGRVSFMNEVAETLTGWSESEARGRPLRDVFRIINEHTRQPVESPVDKVLREGQVVGLANHTALVARDGRECTIDDSGAPIRDAEGRIIGVVLVFRDNTERARAELALRTSEERFRSLCECSPIGILVADGEGNLTYLNGAGEQIGGFSLEDGRNLGWTSFVHPDDRARVGHQWEAARRLDLELRFLHRDGGLRWAKLRTAPIYSEDNRFLGHVGTLEDVTEQRQVEEALRERDRRKDEFLAMLAHELRNPLAPIRSGLEIMRLKGDDLNEIRHVRQMMERQVVHMTRLVDDLLDVSRITRGKINLRREWVELSPVLARAVETVRPLFQQRGQRVHQEVPPGPVLIHADPTRLAQVVANLLHNASKFSPDGALIELVAAVLDGELRIEVRDEGRGIESAMLTRIFEAFVQADGPAEAGHGGLGIGLTLVKSLVELHGGVVEARSAGPGRGSVFVLRLPLQTAPPAIAEAVPSAEGAKPAGPRRILIVDDNADAARSLAQLLTLMGHDTQVAHDAEAALAQLDHSRADLVLLDIGLPRIDGYEVARRLRQEHRFSDLKLVALSGYGQEEDRRRSAEAGFDLHLVKPVDGATLDVMMHRLFLPNSEPPESR